MTSETIQTVTFANFMLQNKKFPQTDAMFCEFIKLGVENRNGGIFNIFSLLGPAFPIPLWVGMHY